MEQLLCARGYSDQVAGFASSSYLFSGCIAALPVSIVASKIKKSLQISKMLLVVGTISGVNPKAIISPRADDIDINVVARVLSFSPNQCCDI